MTQEEKQLLLQDLCARLPYGVKIKLGDYDYQVYGYDSEKEMPLKIWYYYDSNVKLKSYIDVYLTDYRPYLRPIFSMTLEEHKEYRLLNDLVTIDGALVIDATQIDWLNAHHFDYRGLIGKGLAIEAPEGMYN